MMLSITRHPAPGEWPDLLRRPAVNFDNVLPVAEKIIAAVKKGGDAALIDFARQFDGIQQHSIEVEPGEWAVVETLDAKLKNAIDTAAQNITRFHQTQTETPAVIETMPGIKCWRKPVAIENAGLYIPGGSAPLFSTLLMLAIPARIAGVKQMIVCTPPAPDGTVHPAILYAAQRAGVSHIYKAGGAQAIAAMAYGTETIPAVNKIFGPGNQYVTAAKMWLSTRGIAIDMPAGPSELAILADSTCVPAYVAADLLSQAEHGPDSQVILVSDNETVLAEVNRELEAQLSALPRKDFVTKALQNSRSVLVDSLQQGMELINQYAPEHLIIASTEPERWAEQVINAGSVFLGNYAPESAGDYASGTNHTLPTSGFAKAYSGVSVDSFVKKITFQQLTAAGLGNIASTVVAMARAEGLQAHANAVSIRLSHPGSSNNQQ